MKGTTLRIITSPWVLLSILIIPGGLWLVNNLWVITDNLDRPYALLAGPAFIGSILAGWFFVAFFKTIVASCKTAWSAFQGWRTQEGSTFWLVIYIFLIVSVLESGTYFNELLGSNSLFNTLGYAAAFVVDLIAVECMRARLGATRMRDKIGRRIYLLGVIACAGLSAWANTYTSLKHYVIPVGTNLPGIMITIAPWTGMAFPLLIILMSFAADYTADQTSTKLDPEKYKEQEKKRINLLEIQRDMLRDRVKFEHEIDQLSRKLKAEKQWSFPWSKSHSDIDEIVAIATEEIRQEYGFQIASLVQQIEELKVLQTFEKASQSEEHETFSKVQMTEPLEKITRKLDMKDLEVLEKKPAPERRSFRRKSGQKLPKLTKYLYTKKEAALKAKCSDFEVEKAIKEGVLQIQKNGDKILKSSLSDFIVARQKEAVG